MTATLYCFGESGNAYKAALTLELAGAAWAPRYVDFFNGETRTAAFRALNVMGEVPVYVEPADQGGRTLTQSAVIQLHVAETAGRFLGAGPAARAEVLRWLMFDNHKVSAQAGALRFQMNFLPAAKRSADVVAFLALRLQAALKVLDTHLAGRDWLAGEEPSIADFAACGYLYYPEPFGFARADFPAIDRWLGRIAALPGWKHPYDLMPGNPSDRAK
jgi:glutathione S-transferase